MTSGIPAPTATNTTAPQSSATAASSAASQPVTENMFLQLLVAQLQNQDPLNPADGTQFISELAQFQQLETSMNTGTDVSSILQDMNELVAAQSTTTTQS
jgi:flagellar basal-body rod modification protein FlgD